MSQNKLILEDINQLVNPSFYPWVDFEKLCEAIVNQESIEIKSILLEDEKSESSFRNKAMRLLGKAKIPAAAIGLMMMASGAVSACEQGQNKSSKQCFTPQAIEEIYRYQKFIDKEVYGKDKLKMAISEVSQNNPLGKHPDTQKDKMQIVEVESKAGNFYAILDIYDYKNPQLIIPRGDGKGAYLMTKQLVNLTKKATSEWTLWSGTKEVGPITKKWLEILEQSERK
jgi:hypothetical protein